MVARSTAILILSAIALVVSIGVAPTISIDSGAGGVLFQLALFSFAVYLYWRTRAIVRVSHRDHVLGILAASSILSLVGILVLSFKLIG